jgi:hypothetical protein
MDQRHKYEQTITSKLDTLPLPDMADAIWSRIEQQLDTDMPADDGSQGPAPSSPSPKIFIGGSVFIILVAFIGFFLTRKSAPEQQTVSPIVPPSNTEIEVSKPPGEITSPSFKPGQPNRSTNPVFNNTGDSVAAIPRVDLIDSVQKQDALVQLPAPVTIPQKDSVVQGKKKRGVSGINDSDYRIVPKKDSLR